MRKIFYTCLILALGIGLSGCSDSKNNSQTKKIEKKQKSGLGSWEPISEETNNGNMPTF